MPKHSTLMILKRLREMDAELMSGLLHVPTFARRWRVSTKTVHRDLKTFGKLGRGSVLTRGGSAHEDVWEYLPGTRRLFLPDGHKNSKIGPAGGAPRE